MKLDLDDHGVFTVELTVEQARAILDGDEGPDLFSSELDEAQGHAMSHGQSFLLIKISTPNEVQKP